MELKESVKVGDVYRHYRNKDYRIIGIGRHSETHEEMIVYQALYDSPDFGHNALWIRPLALFFEHVEIEGKKVRRFSRVA